MLKVNTGFATSSICFHKVAFVLKRKLQFLIANGEQQYTVENFIYFNFLDTICIIHFTRQMIQFYVSHSCKHNLYVTPFETNDLI